MHYCAGGRAYFSHNDGVGSTLSDQLCTRPIFSMIPSIFPPDSSPCAQPSVLTEKNLQTIENLRLFFLATKWHKVTLSCQVPHEFSHKFIFPTLGDLYPFYVSMSFLLFFLVLFGNVTKTVSAYWSGPCPSIALQWWQLLQPAPASVRSSCAHTLPLSHPRADLVRAGLWPIPHPAYAKGTEIRP